MKQRLAISWERLNKTHSRFDGKPEPQARIECQTSPWRIQGWCVSQIEVHNKRAKEQSWGNILLARATQPYEQVVKIEIKSASRWGLLSGFFFCFFFFEKKKRVIFSLFRRNYTYRDFPGGADSKVSAYNVGDVGLIPGSGRSSGEGNGNPLQYSCLENPVDRGAWWATVHGVAKSRTRLRD